MNRFLRFLILVLALSAESGLAHPTQFTTLQIKVEPDGQFRAVLNIDILSYALGKTSAASSNDELQAELDGPRSDLGRDLADASARFQREVVIQTDAGDVVPTAWELPGLPEVDAVLARKIQPPILMPGEITFTGQLPISAHTIAIRLPYILGDTVQVYELPGGESHDEPVSAGDYSSDVKLALTPPSTDLSRYVVAGIIVAAIIATCWMILRVFR